MNEETNNSAMSGGECTKNFFFILRGGEKSSLMLFTFSSVVNSIESYGHD
jgi:hypothetical protein